MLQSFNQALIAEAKETPSLPIFSDEAIEFLSELSKRTMKAGRAYSDVVTFGYWCRPSALKSYARAYEGDPLRIGKGLAFHIAPSNVPVNFAFSLAAGLLAGNKNIVKIPSKDFPQVRIIGETIEEVIANGHKHMKPYISLVRYDRTSEATAQLSQACDARIIWGGDATVDAVRKNTIPPRATEIAFADRNSFAVIDAQDYLATTDKANVAQGFYNDTLFSDQNACTSPRLVIWIGDETATKNARSIFWDEFDKQVKAEAYDLAPVHAVGKLAALYQSAAHRATELETPLSQPAVMCLAIAELNPSLFADRYHSGFFFEYRSESIADILPLCNDPSIQTVSYLGGQAEALAQAVAKAGVSGVDRIVPIGKTMDFELTWDGIDLIRQLSRVISIR